MSAHALPVAPFEMLGFMRSTLVACLALAVTVGAVGTLHLSFGEQHPLDHQHHCRDEHDD